MRDFLDQLDTAAAADLYYLTLSATLMLPDIAGAMDAPDGRSTRWWACTRSVEPQRAHAPPVSASVRARDLRRAAPLRLIESTPGHHRALITTLIFTGMRISEAIGLVWRDVDLDQARVHVRRQLDDLTRERVDLKTGNAVRSIVLMDSLATLLRQHKLASPFSKEDDPVFATANGGFANRHNVNRRVLRPSAERAGVEGLRLHDLRHCYASMLIARGASVVFVSRQMGHASPAMTLSTYSHLFDQREHAEQMAALMEEQFGIFARLAS